MKVLFIVIAFSFFGSCVAGGGYGYRSVFQGELSEIRDSLGRGQLSQAVQDLSMLIDMDPKNREAMELRAVAYQKLGQFENAVKDYASLIERYSDDARYNYNLGMIYAFKLIDKEAALRHFDRFLTLDIDNQRAFDVAKLMCSLNASRRRPLITHEQDVFSRWSYDKAIKEDDHEVRRSLLLDSVDLDPSRPEPYLALAVEFEAKGDQDSAISYYRKAVDIDPTSAEAHAGLGRLLIGENKRNEASIHMIKASLFSPNEQDPVRISGK